MSDELRKLRRQRVQKSLYRASKVALDGWEALEAFKSFGEVIPKETDIEVAKACISALKTAIDAIEKDLPCEHTAIWPFQAHPYKKLDLQKRQCKGVKPNGVPCRASASRGSLFCKHHQDTDLESLPSILGRLSLDSNEGTS
jgi:hypothetical protein